MTDESEFRELASGMLAKETHFQLLVIGPVGVREIERLIQKLELDKTILAEVGTAREFLS